MNGHDQEGANTTEKKEYTFKLLIIGESDVGKTCILIRFSDGKFSKTQNTIGIDYRMKVIMCKENQVKLKIFDTAGQEKFRNITKQFYKNADGIMLVYDVTSRDSFENIGYWMRQIQMFTQKENISTILIGNKSDSQARTVSFDEGQKLSQEYNIKFLETSAANGENIEEAFSSLSQELIGRSGNDKEEIRESIKLKQSNTKNHEEKVKKKCCK
jgi:small GTP-binding protein